VKTKKIQLSLNIEFFLEFSHKCSVLGFTPLGYPVSRRLTPLCYLLAGEQPQAGYPVNRGSDVQKKRTPPEGAFCRMREGEVRAKF